MIYIFRKEMKKWQSVLWIILVALVASSVSLIVFKKQDPGSVPIAKVNGSPITFNQYNRSLYQIRMQIESYKSYAKAYGISVDFFLNIAGLNNPTKAAFDRCVRNEVLDGEASDFNIKLASDYFSDKLLQILPPQLKDESGNINIEAYKFYLSRLMTSVSKYEEDMEEEFKRELVNDFISKSLYIPRNKAKEIFIQNNDSKSFSFIKLPFSSFLDDVKKIEPSKDKVRSFFDKNKENYRLPEQKKARYWVISAKDYAKKVNVGDEAIQNFYQRNKSSLFRIPPEIKVKSVLVEVDENASPEKVEELLSKAKSIHKQIKQKPSELDNIVKKNAQKEIKTTVLDFFKRGTHGVEFEKAAFRLKEKNSVSDVVKTDRGYEIILLLDRIPAKEKPLDKVKDEIIKTIKAKRALNMLKGDLERAIYNAKKNKKAISEFINKNSFESKTSEWLTKDKSIGNTLENTLAEKIFSDKKKNAKNGFFSYKDNQVLFEVTSVEKSKIPNFNSIQAKVTEDFFINSAKEKIKAEAKKIKKQVLNNKLAFEDIAKKANLNLERTKMIKKSSENDALPKTIIDKAFLLNDSKKQVLVTRDHSDYYCVQLLQSSKPDLNEFKQEEFKIIKEEQGRLYSGYTGAFVASLIRNAKIEKLKKF